MSFEDKCFVGSKVNSCHISSLFLSKTVSHCTGSNIFQGFQNVIRFEFTCRNLWLPKCPRLNLSHNSQVSNPKSLTKVE